MYSSHRGMVPAPNSRLTELLEQVRQEFADQQSRSSDYEHKIQQQIQEMDLVRQNVFQLEAAHGAMKQKYEDEIARLNRELDARGGAHVAPHGSQNAGPSAQPPPPSLPAGAGLFVAKIPVSYNSLIAVLTFAGGHVGSYGNPAPQPTASPGPGKGRRPGGPGGPATPQQNQPPNYNSDPRGSPQVARPRSPASCLGDLEYDRVPANQKKEGPDWFAIFNPKVPRLLDVDLVHTLEHNSVVCCVRFSQDGKWVATGCNRSAQIFDVKTGGMVSRLQDESVDRDGDLYIRSVCFSPDGRYLATGAEDKQIRVWDIQGRTIKQTFQGHEQDIYSLDFARNGRHIASGSGDRTVRVWDIESGQNVLTLSIEDGVTTVAISPDGRHVAAGSLDKSVRVWDAHTGFLVERLEGAEGHKDSVYSVAFAPNGRDLVSGSLDKTIKMWELSAARGLMPGGGTSRGKCVKTFEGHKDFVLSVALTPDGNWVLSGSKDRGVQFWDPRTASAQLMLQGHKNSVISVAPSPSGGLFATGSGDMRARIWSYEPYHHQTNPL
ncbi:WD40 repeat-like protein [Tuber magnatum]|uniref:WD40 repeat-like protein n=1 Tax=Tuber magnatum TaxID=42249 RepID=A0A317T0Z6_9PEZI|nr:WD40 repeat-like protein [Tuber magnatum]